MPTCLPSGLQRVSIRVLPFRQADHPLAGFQALPTPKTVTPAGMILSDTRLRRKNHLPCISAVGSGSGSPAKAGWYAKPERTRNAPNAIKKTEPESACRFRASMAQETEVSQAAGMSACAYRSDGLSDVHARRGRAFGVVSRSLGPILQAPGSHGGRRRAARGRCAGEKGS